MTAMRTMSTTQAKKMDQLATMPWLKFDYTNYEQSEFRAANSPIARLAFVELTMRSIRTGFKLPKNDAALATWAGITKAQWAKVKDVVISQFEETETHYVCTGIAELYGEYVTREESQDTDESPKSKGAERVRRHREKQRNAQNNADVTPSVTPVTLDVTPVTPTCNADVTLDTVTSVTFGGIKGGDLDQDLDFRNNPPYPPIDLPMADFREPADRSEKTFAQAKIDTIPQDWIDLAKQKYPDLTDQNIDLIFANMVSTYTSKTKYMGTKVRDWKTKWVEQLVIKAPDLIAKNKAFSQRAEGFDQIVTPPVITQAPKLCTNDGVDAKATAKAHAAAAKAALLGGAS